MALRPDAVATHTEDGRWLILVRANGERGFQDGSIHGVLWGDMVVDGALYRLIGVARTNVLPFKWSSRGSNFAARSRATTSWPGR